MLTVIQRVTHAKVVVDDETIGEISNGLLILCGFEASDSQKTLLAMLDKCLKYRIFDDGQGKMNLSIRDANAGLLLVPQFTLVADTARGLRPSFSKGAPPEQGNRLFTQLVAKAQNEYPMVASGRFGANMQVHLCNDGPVTFILRFE